VSLLFRCTLRAPLDASQQYTEEAPRPNQWRGTKNAQTTFSSYIISSGNTYNKIGSSLSISMIESCMIKSKELMDFTLMLNVQRGKI